MRSSALYATLWKHCVIRKRQLFLTSFEVLVPIAVIAFVTYVRSVIPGFNKIYLNETTRVPPFDGHSLQTKVTVNDISVYYTPNVKFTDDLIREVQLKLGLYNHVIKGFSRDIDLYNSYNNNTSCGTNVVIIFSNVEQDIPKRLEYNLKIYKESLMWSTKELYYKSMSYIPGIGSEKYIDSSFLPIQFALETSYIEIVTNKSLDTTFEFEEFPYPPHFVDSEINSIFLKCLPLLTILCFLFVCASSLNNVVQEKASGIKELMKINGLKDWCLWLGWFLNGFLLNVASLAVIVILLKCRFWSVEYAPIEHCHWFVLLLFLMLYCSATISFMLLFSTFFNRATLASTLGILLWIAGFLILTSISNSTISHLGLKRVFALMPNVALYYGYDIISVFEVREMNLNFTNMFELPTESPDDFSFGFILLYLLLETIVYFALTLYLDQILPDPYGIPKSWHFIFPKQILRNANSIGNVNLEDRTNDMEGMLTRNDNNIMVRVHNLTKEYEHVTAVNKLNIDFNRGTITSLLGQNGAGKTTTMSMITGMTNPTSGSVFIDGINIMENLEEARKLISICPQHDLLFKELSVWQHLVFFGLLRGLTKNKSEELANDLLQKKLKLPEKKHSLVTSLSGGMKRKLSLGIALMGKPKLLILDEPTAGIDVEGRRDIWNLILSYRSSHTILISTHFLEEADELSDRIAIMDRGTLVDVGTPISLRNKYGLGYICTIAYNEGKFDKVEEIVKRHVPEAVLLNDTENGAARDVVKFLLPNSAKQQFTALFTELYNTKMDVVQNFRLANSTLEDVVLKVMGCLGYICTIVYNVGKFDKIEEIVKRHFPEAALLNDTENNFARDVVKFRLPNSAKQQVSALFTELDTKKPDLVKNYKLDNSTPEDVVSKDVNTVSTKERAKIQNDKKRSNHFLNLWRKFWHLVKNHLNFLKKTYHYCLAMVLLLSLIVIITVCTNKLGYQNVAIDGATLPLNLKIYGTTRVYFTINGTDYGRLQDIYRDEILSVDSIPFPIDDVDERIVKIGIENIVQYKKMVVAAELNVGQNDIKTARILYSNNALHGAPISLNLVMNTILKYLTGETDYSISVSNTPLHATTKSYVNIQQSAGANMLLWFFFLPLGPLFLMSAILIYPTDMQLNEINVLQKLCGIPVFLYWIKNYIVDFCLVLSVLLVLVLAFLGLNIAPEYRSLELLAILCLYCAVNIPFGYLFTRLKSIEVAILRYLTISMLCGLVFAGALLTAEAVEASTFWLGLFRFLVLCVPQASLTYLLGNFAMKVAEVHNWDIKTESELDLICRSNQLPCCEPSSEECTTWRSAIAYDSHLIVFHLLIGFINFLIVVGADSGIEFNYILEVTHSIFSVTVQPIFRVMGFCKPNGGDVTDKSEAPKGSHIINVAINSGNGVENESLKMKHISNDLISNSENLDSIKTDNAETDNSGELFSVEGITKTYYKWGLLPRDWERIIPIKNLTFHVAKRECYGLLGVNGAGKTTAFRILTRAVRHCGGRIRSENDFLYMGYCPQGNALIERFSTFELVQLFGKLRSDKVGDDDVERLLEKCGLIRYKHVPCGTLSGGNKRKLNMAIAVISCPELLLLDEPTTGVDLLSRRELWNIITELKKESSVILTSHSMEECEALCDKIAVMKSGEILKEGTIPQLKQEYCVGYMVIIEFESNEALNNNASEIMGKLRITFGRAGNVIEKDQSLNTIQVQIKRSNWDDIFMFMEHLKHPDYGYGIHDYLIKEVSFEDVFLTIAKS